MPDVITFAVPLPPVALRRNRETRNKGYKARLVREYQEVVWCAGHEGIASALRAYYRANVNAVIILEQPWGRAEVTYRWYSTHPTDEDNIIANMKPALDVYAKRRGRGRWGSSKTTGQG